MAAPATKRRPDPERDWQRLCALWVRREHALRDENAAELARVDRELNDLKESYPR